MNKSYNLTQQILHKKSIQPSSLWETTDLRNSCYIQVIVVLLSLLFPQQFEVCCVSVALHYSRPTVLYRPL